MVWSKRGERKGARRMPEALRQRVLKRYPTCWLAIDGVCIGTSTQVHHKKDAADFDDPNDPKIDTEDQLVGVCEPCHTLHSARQSQKRSVKAAWDWKRQPEQRPNVG